MLFYSRERFIKAHQDVTNPYYNHSYGRYVRDAICSNCGKVIGEQVKYDIEKTFSFAERDFRDYKHCPYCGEAFTRGDC